MRAVLVCRGVSGDLCGQKGNSRRFWRSSESQEGGSRIGRLLGLRRANESIFRFRSSVLLLRRRRVAQWETSSTLDLQSGVTVSQTEVWCDGRWRWFWSSVLVEDASEGLFHRRSLPEDELCSGYAVEVHIPAPDGDASRLAGGET